MLDRRTSKNMLMYLAYQGLRYVAPVVLTPFLAHSLAKKEFSDLVILNSCIWTSTVFMEFGFYLYGVSKTAVAADRTELSTTVTAISIGKLLLAPIALCAYVGLAAWSGLLVRNPSVVAIGALSAIGYGASFAWFFQGQQRGGAAVLIEAIPQVVYYALVLALVRGPQDFWLVALAQTVPPIASLAVSLVLIFRTGLWGALDFSAIRCVMSEAFPYFVERFCFTLYTAVTPTLIAVLSVASEASYYSIGDRVGVFLGTLPGPIFQAAVPFVSKTVRKDGGWRLPLTMVASVTIAVGTVAAATYLTIGLIIGQFFSNDFRPAVAVARVFCVNAVISVLGMAFANFVIIPRNVARIMLWSSTTALVVGLIVQAFLVPRYGAIGAVLSRATSETIVTSILGAFVIRMFFRERNARTGG